MSKPSLLRDPRTIARSIPGIFDPIFPQLSPATVAFFNRNSSYVPNLIPISDAVVAAASISQPMLFEIAYALAEQLIVGTLMDFSSAVQIAADRQAIFFDAKAPTALSELDRSTAMDVAKNLVSGIRVIEQNHGNAPLVLRPFIPGYRWVSSGEGDFSIGTTLIEVKCTSRSFRAADYRQILMYWLLSFGSAIENRATEWEKLILLNPRQNRVLELSISQILEAVAPGRSKIEILELFVHLLDDYGSRQLPELHM